MKALVIVHPGDLLPPKNGRDFCAAYRLNPAFGSYEDYVANLRKLCRTNIYSVFLVSEFKGKIFHDKAVQPRNVVIGWPCYAREPMHLLKKTGSKWKLGKHIHETALGPFLQAQGIDEVLLAGELGPYQLNHSGCAGYVYQLVSPHLPVKGIQGCVFPIIPHYDAPLDYKTAYGGSREWNSDVAAVKRAIFRDIYEEAVSLEEAVQTNKKIKQESVFISSCTLPGSLGRNSFPKSRFPTRGTALSTS